MSSIEIGCVIIIVAILLYIGGKDTGYNDGYSHGEKDTIKKLHDKEPCDFCKGDDDILAYREDKPKERRVAEFCPLCGRKLQKDEDKQ